MDKEKINREFDKLFHKPILFLDFSVFILLIVPFIVRLPQEILELFQVLDFTIWIFIILEVSIKLFVSKSRSGYLLSNWEDVLAALILIIPNLRLLKNVSHINVTRLIRSIAIIKRIYYKLGKMLTKEKQFSRN